jgi:polyisoprenoid-binding protein YceI
MKKCLFTLGMFLFAYNTLTAQTISTQTGKINFFSKTPVENIDAVSNRVLAVLNTEKSTLAFKIANTSFEFENKLRQEHFNEKYMESEQFPYSTFSGKINETVDFTKDGEYPVTVKGKLNIHGVEIERTIPGNIKIQNGEITMQSEFKVLVKDHKIKIPKLVVANIAEEITVNVTTMLKGKEN